MSPPSSSNTTVSDSSRDEVLSILEASIHDVSDRIESREVTTPEDEQLLIKWYRTLGTLAGQYRKLQKDTDIDEMEEDLELLEEVTNLEDRG